MLLESYLYCKRDEIFQDNWDFFFNTVWAEAERREIKWYGLCLAEFMHLNTVSIVNITG